MYTVYTVITIYVQISPDSGVCTLVLYYLYYKCIEYAF